MFFLHNQTIHGIMNQENLGKNERCFKARGENNVKFTKKIVEDVFY